MALPLALTAIKALKAMKALKASKVMGSNKAMGSKKLMTKGSNNVGSKANLKASKEKLKAAKKKKRLDRITKIRDNMEARAKQQNMESRDKQQEKEQESSGESKKKESIKELYDKAREGLERKDRRSDAMSSFVTKGTMKKGGKYEDGGRKGPLKKVKAAIRKANNKAGAVKNRLEKKVLEAVKRKKAMKKMPGGGKMDLYKKGGKKFPDLNKDGKVTMADILQGRGVIKKAEKGMKYENGGKFSKTKRLLRPMEKMSGTDRKTVGNPASNESVKKFSKISRGSVADMELRSRGKSAAGFLKATQKAQEVPNPGLAKKTEDFGPGYGKKTYSSGNPGGLKGRTKGKGGNVGAGVKVKKKRRR